MTQITPELIREQEALKELDDKQIVSIIGLLNNKIGAIHGQYDKDIKEITGIEKPQGEKTYDHMKSVLSDLKKAAGGAVEIKKDLDALKKEKTELEEALKGKSGDESLKAKLQENESLVKKLRTQLETKEEGFKKEKESLQNQMSSMKFGNEFERSLQGVKFKKEIPDSVRSTYIDTVKNRIASNHKHTFMEVEGKQQLVFLDEQGEIMRDEKNGLRPVTLNSLATKELSDIIDPGARQTGAGGSGVTPTGSSFDIGGARTKPEAVGMIEKQLLSEGYVRTDPVFAEKTAEILKESGANKLPISEK